MDRRSCAEPPSKSKQFVVCVSRPSIIYQDTGEFMEAKEKLVGTWKLESALSTTPAGERMEPPYGPNPAGLLTYTADGRVSVVISYGGRKPLSVVGGTSAQTEEQAEAFKTFLAYAGRYKLSGAPQTHHTQIYR